MALPKAAVIKKARNVRLFAMDVDGVLTAGEIIVLNSGEEIKLWNAKDRQGFALLRDQTLALSTAWITGRESNAVRSVAAELKIDHVVQKCMDKRAALQKILNEKNLTFADAAYVGDDIIDLGVMRAVGFAACPSDAVPDIQKISHYISPLRGGAGVARDVLELILKAQGKWNAVIQRFS
jgi:3-deoxy-D-manno-octulosonate 8-phosphate phosphatase (KDO 8-P phosphatase)